MTTNNSKHLSDDIKNGDWYDNLITYTTVVAIAAWLGLIGWAGVSAISQSIKKHRSGSATKEVLRPSSTTKTP